jgi:hypothetical protein
MAALLLTVADTPGARCAIEAGFGRAIKAGSGRATFCSDITDPMTSAASGAAGQRAGAPSQPAAVAVCDIESFTEGRAGADEAIAALARLRPAEDYWRAADKMMNRRT